jgi:hypothetical protein
MASSMDDRSNLLCVNLATEDVSYQDDDVDVGGTQDKGDVQIL